MKHEIRRWLAVLAVSSLIAACGGGGGSGGGGGGGASASLMTISGQVVASSASGSAAKAALITDGVAISIASYDKASNTKLGEASVTSDASGGFVGQLNLSTGGGYVIVTATKAGYTQFQKRVDYTTPGNIELQAALQQANVAFATPGSALASGIGKSSVPSFSFALVRYPNGTKKALAGTAIKAAKAAGGTVETSIDIPAASVPGVTKLQGELNAYEPSTDSASFPGSYTGTDKDGKDGKMVSLAFDYIKITDADTGKSLGKVAADLAKAGVKKAAAAETTVTRYIYTSSCDNLFITDYNANAAGHQVPVWTLNPNTGKWIFLGEGTVVDSAGTIISSPTATSCGAGGYYLKILVSNTDFTNSWWNLDHIIFSTPKEVCLSGKIKRSDNTPVASQGITLYGSIIDSKWGYTDANGNYSLSTILLNKDTASRAATLSYYDENGGYKTADVTLGNSPNCIPQPDIVLPKVCEISGKLTGDNPSYRYLRLNGNDFYRTVSSDYYGVYSSKVKCGTDIDLYLGSLSSSSAKFNVNGTVADGETTDDGNKVVLADITVPNIPPNGYIWFSNSSVRVDSATPPKNRSLTAYISGYDEDSNYPIAWALNIKGSSSPAYTTSGSFSSYSSYNSLDLTGQLAAGDYTTELVLTDSKGASRTITGAKLNVSATFRPPVVTAYADKTYVNSCGGSTIVNLYGSGFGPDSDTMTGTWTSGGASVAGTTADNCSGGTGTSSVRATCTTTLPAAASTTYTYTVTDNNGKIGKQDITISTYSTAPWISTLTATPTLVPDTATGTARDVALSATANNYDNVSMTGSWKVNGTAIATCDGTVASGSNSKCSYSIPTTAVKGDVFTFTFTAAACGKATSRDVKVTYGNASDVTIVIQ